MSFLVRNDVYIPQRKYQVKPHSSAWFSAACAAAIVHRYHFFCLYQKDKSSASKVKFRQASNCCKRVLKQSCFPDCWKVSSVFPVFKNVRERSAAKNYHPVSLFSVISKVFEKLMNNEIVDHLGKCGLFSDFQNDFRSS